MITTVTSDRRPVFHDLFAARIVVQALRHYHHSDKARTWCYVLMPDHLHWLVQLGDDLGLSDLVRSMKTYTSREVNRLDDRDNQRLWQSGFHDHAIRKDEDLKDLIRYIIENPVRAGLERSPRNYSHWDGWWFDPKANEPTDMASTLVDD